MPMFGKLGAPVLNAAVGPVHPELDLQLEIASTVPPRQIRKLLSLHDFLWCGFADDLPFSARQKMWIAVPARRGSCHQRWRRSRRCRRLPYRDKRRRLDLPEPRVRLADRLRVLLRGAVWAGACPPPAAEAHLGSGARATNRRRGHTRAIRQRGTRSGFSKRASRSANGCAENGERSRPSCELVEHHDGRLRLRFSRRENAVAGSIEFAKNGIATASYIGTIFSEVTRSFVICTDRRPPETPP